MKTIRNHYKIFIIISTLLIIPYMSLCKAEVQQLLKSNTIPCFHKNMGQWDSSIFYKINSSGKMIRFLKDKISYGMSREISASKNTEGGITSGLESNTSRECIVWNQQFVGVSSNVLTEGINGTQSKNHYIKSNDPNDWVNSALQYDEIIYKGLYPSIDLRYYFTNPSHNIPESNLQFKNQSNSPSRVPQVKYDFMVRPGGNINNIQLRFQGIESLNISRDGHLEIIHSWGQYYEDTPYSYQIADDGKKKTIDITYQLIDETTFGFQVNGNYDNQQTLIIDPIIMDWGTYIGGGATGDGYINDMLIDEQNNVYITGWYTSTFPVTPGSYDMTHNGDYDIFITKLRSDGTTLDFSTYLGGNQNDIGYSIRMNQNKEIYIGGFTNSTNLPIAGSSFSSTFNGGFADGFVLRTSEDGTTLLYSTYLGGSDNDFIVSAIPNDDGEIYVTGSTLSDSYPTTTGSFSETHYFGTFDIFASKISAVGNNLIYSTFIGGSGGDYSNDLALDELGNLIIVGVTSSADMPTTTDSFDETFNGMNDIFLCKLNPTGSDLEFSTYLGGSSSEEIGCLTVGKTGDIYIGGSSSSPDFPTTTGAYQENLNGTFHDMFIAKLNGNASDVLYSTLIGGSTKEVILDIAETTSGELAFSGWSNSEDFPVTTCAFSNQYNGGYSDMIFGKLSSDGSKVPYSSYIGGGKDDYLYNKVAITNNSCESEIIVSGTVHSTDFPTTSNAFQPVKFNGILDDQPVVFKMKPEINPDFLVTMNDCEASFTDLSNGNCIWEAGSWSPSNWYWDFGDGTTSNEQNPVHKYDKTGAYNVKLITDCPKDSITRTIDITSVCCTDSSIIAVATPEEATIHSGESIGLNSSSGISYFWEPPTNLSDPGIANPMASPEITTSYVVTISDSNGCTSKDTILIIVEGQEFTLFIPNSFTPNQDQNNSLFQVKGTGIVEFNISIYNRWGELIFESNDMNNSWDGRLFSKNIVQEDTYSYIINTQNHYAERNNYIGSVSVVK